MAKPGEIGPEKLFSARLSRTSEVREKRVWGSSPVKKLCCRLVMLEKDLGGSSPERPIPRKWSSTTEELSGEQLTPGQAQGVGLERF
ncbi:hypothetical protein SASPL_119592 [Salvia splendens]|uniref:Uncharacterized protein n=1 Tax=Salvia splendens TaxID=180675 RepID=A0A8X8ZUI4_SALSN|nr:hypothetical protein SASPL_119592 [Salvia splendens]